jgi:hypothetical protein
LRAALWVGAIGSLFTFLPIAFSSIRSVRELPEPVDAVTAAEAELSGGIVEGVPVPSAPALD